MGLLQFVERLVKQRQYRLPLLQEIGNAETRNQLMLLSCVTVRGDKDGRRLGRHDVFLSVPTVGLSSGI